jgi:hypothetical protein
MEKGRKWYNILTSQNLNSQKSVVINKCSVDFKMRRGTKKSEEGREKHLIDFLHLTFSLFF